MAEPAIAPDDVDLRAVLWIVLALVVTILLATAAAYAAWQGWGPASSGSGTGLVVASAGPRLQSAPQPERAAYFAEKERLLDSWQWIDRQAGIARIPLEQAMQLMVQRNAGAEQKP
ncbi:MAG TPA: hypothetical protein VJ603_06470 [Paucimonas sp.]|nr:hypothetical protein [Paucimonas sp.]HJW57722.1 hypothetical protein [Burkholderiaceae bacterium]